MIPTGRQIGLLLLLCCSIPVPAQTPIAFQYFYDELGQLTKVIDSAGNVIEYVYDAVGNMLEIRRTEKTPDPVAVFNITPQQGAPTRL